MEIKENKIDIFLKELTPVSVCGIFIILGIANHKVSYLAFAGAAIYICVSDIERSFYLLFFMVPFAAVFKTSASSTSLFTYLELVFVARQFIKYRKINKRFFIALTVFSFYVFLGTGTAYTTLIKQIMIPCILYCFFFYGNTNLKKMICYFSFGLLFSSIVALFMDQIPNLNKYILLDPAYEVGRDVLRKSGLYSDPNYYSLALIMAIICLFIFFVNKQMNIAVFPIIGVFIVFGAQTISKSFLLFLAISLLLFVLMLFLKGQYGGGIVCVITLIVLGGLILNQQIEIFNNTLVRLNNSNATTGRSDVWIEYINYIFGGSIFKMLFGNGIGSILIFGAAHNTYIDFLYFYGVAGTVIFAITCRYSIPEISSHKHQIENYCPTICLMLMLFFLSSLTYFDFVFMIIIAVSMYRYDFSVESLTTSVEVID